jgi:two-component system LytT family response regulator
MRTRQNRKSKVHQLCDNPDYLLVGSKHKGTYIQKHQIVYIEACESYSWIYVTNGSRILSSKTIGYYEKIFLKEQFSRIHRSYLINLLHLKGYEPNYRLIHLSGDITLPVSHRRNRMILKMINSQTSNLLFKVAI